MFDRFFSVKNIMEIVLYDFVNFKQMVTFFYRPTHS